RGFSESRLLKLSLALVLVGSLVLQLNVSVAVLFAGLVIFGAGMSAGVPLMLGIVGGLFRDMAGTAFSAVIVIGLLGNLSLNYLMGYIAEHYGIRYFSYGILIEWVLMAMLSVFIIRSLQRNSISDK